MSDIHIDDFYRDVAKILLQLYSYFPRKSTLYVEDISGPDTPDDFGLHSERHQACFSAMIWLAESHYIQYIDTVRQEALDQVVLTHKAFTLLSSRATFLPATAATSGLGAGPADLNKGSQGLPERESQQQALPTSVLESSRTNIAQLRKALQEGSSTTLRQIVHQLLLESRHHR